jgi:hypothetical protein
MLAPNRMRIALGLALTSLAGLVFASGACRSHNALALTSATAASSSTSSGMGGASSASSSSSTGGAGGEGGMDAGPPGPSKLTIVNGIVDYDAVRLCFLPYPAGDPKAKPWPSDPKGIAFAKAIVVDPIASAIPSGSDVQPIALAGNLAAIANATCDDAITTSGVASVQLPILPASAFDAHKSVALVTAGCMGGPGHDDATAKLACGMAYAPDQPTATLFAMAMGRASDPSHVGLQVALASAPAPPFDYYVRPGEDMPMDALIAMNLSAGSASAQTLKLKLSDLANLSTALIVTKPPNDPMTLTSAVPLSEVFGHGNVMAAQVLNGAHFTLVGVGGYPGVPPAAWWHGFTYALVDGDP